MSRLLICSLSDPDSDPRVMRQISALGRHHEVVFVGYGSNMSRHEISRFIELPAHSNVTNKGVIKYTAALRDKQFLLRVLESMLPHVHDVCSKVLLRLVDWLWGRTVQAGIIRKTLRNDRFDLIIANDFYAFVMADAVRAGVPLLYDAHEYTPDQGSSVFWIKRKKPYIIYALNERLSRVDAMMTVSSGIADLYMTKYGIPRPVVVRNAAEFVEMEPSEREDETIRLVHHGICVRDRHLELMVLAMQELPGNFRLDLYLVIKSSDYLDELKQLAQNDPRITFHEPIPIKEIPKVLNNYDIGLIFYPPETVNLQFSLPNKLFEFIQARIATVSGPSEEIGSVIAQYGIGTTTKDFTVQALVACLRRMAHSDIHAYKKNTMKAARELSWASQAETMVKYVEGVIEHCRK